MGCFSRCCCCVNLRTGGLMMGIMTLALSVFSIIPMSISLVNRDYLARATVHMLNKIVKNETDISHQELWTTMADLVDQEREQNQQLPPDDDPQVERLRTAMLVFFIVCIILLVVYLVVSIMLMYGSVKGNRWCLLPWLVATLLFIIAYLVGISLSTVLFGLSLLSLVFLVVAVTESIIALYLWMCVVSLFQHLGNRNNANQAWELKPRFTATYKGIPQSDR